MSSSDVSLVTNHFSTAAEGFVTTTGGSVNAGATTVPLNSTSGLTNGKVFVGIIEPGTSGKEQTFTGLVDTSGSQITNVVWTRGTNTSHSAGVSVVDYVTGTQHNMMTKGILVEHSQDGTHGNITPDSVTTPTLVATELTTTDVATLNSVVTNTIGGNGANHIALSAGLNKLVKSTVLRQDDTTNTYEVGNTVVLTGWGVIVPGGTTVGNETVNFGVTFAQRPIILISSGGDNTSGTLTYGAGTAARNNFYAEAHTITTSSFNARVISTSAWTAGDSVFYQWIAVGEV